MHHASKTSDSFFIMLHTDEAHAFTALFLCSSGTGDNASIPANPASQRKAKPILFAFFFSSKGFQLSRQGGSSLSVTKPPRPLTENIPSGCGGSALRSLSAIVDGTRIAAQNGGAW